MVDGMVAGLSWVFWGILDCPGFGGLIVRVVRGIQGMSIAKWKVGCNAIVTSHSQFNLPCVGALSCQDGLGNPVGICHNVDSLLQAAVQLSVCGVDYAAFHTVGGLDVCDASFHVKAYGRCCLVGLEGVAVAVGDDDVLHHYGITAVGRVADSSERYFAYLSVVALEGDALRGTA